MVRWVKNWLKGRAQRVVVNGATSGWRPNTSGDPQGPVLFNIFINVLDTEVERTISKFAGDTKLGGAGDSLGGQEALQRHLDRSEHWAIINGMKINNSKHQILHLGQSNAGTSINWERTGWRAAPQEGIWGCWWAAGTCESAVSPGSQEHKPYPRVHQAQHKQLVKRGDRSTVFSFGVASP
ncbi:rna-directed dna polymerase from mobile element jockey-like [Limosa lapponica baueri]|uniref:Rna-directed dna polymerase from mobile element jockey-like n=1 Tax=Limosa lapponica baueri TaxID=1758121 RepID=A0A2I0UBC1_LIMLA|nr:rna-directed dna polymerase from mobile element jockey-like [Limosa lapponica baueri]